MCYEADNAHHCAVGVWVGKGLGECTWDPPTPQWLEFKDMDDRGHQRGTYAPHNPDPMNCEEVRTLGDRRPDYLCKNRESGLGLHDEAEVKMHILEQRLTIEEEENEAGVTKTGKCFKMRGSQRYYGSQFCKGAEINDNIAEQ